MVQLPQTPKSYHSCSTLCLPTVFDCCLASGTPSCCEEETRGPASLDGLIIRYRSTQDQEAVWLANAVEEELMRPLRSPSIPGGKCSVSQALIQVCMHSHGHRAQCAKLLRRIGGVPPIMDFIHWLANRPAAVWPIPLNEAEP
jgi:hypothetical protein